MSIEGQELVTVNIKYLLDMLADHMITCPEEAIREYVSNAYDASLDEIEPKISVATEPKNVIVRVTDHGRGMTKQEVAKQLIRIGGHFAPNQDKSIGLFGLGVISGFMVSDKIIFETWNSSEPHGWRVTWKAGSVTYTCEPAVLSEKGTTASLHLKSSFKNLTDESQLADNLREFFGLSDMPIYVGGRSQPENRQWAWLKRQGADMKPRLLPMEEFSDVFGQYYKGANLEAGYLGFGSDGTRYYLAIPGQRMVQFGKHMAYLFRKGVLVTSNIEHFFPEPFAFMVALVDCPAFSIQIGRSVLQENDTFQHVLDAIPAEVTQFFALMSEKHPRKLEKLFSIHRDVFLCNLGDRHLSSVRSDLVLILRKHFYFTTTAGDMTWGQLLSHLGGYAPESAKTERTLQVWGDNPETLPDLGMLKGSDGLVVLARGGEYQLLESLANSDNVTLVSFTPPIVTEVTIPMQRLKERLAPVLREKYGVGCVSFFFRENSEHEPTRLDGKLSFRRSRNSAGDSGVYTLELGLNSAHPIIDRYAGIQQTMGHTAFVEAADQLFALATLRCALPEPRQAVEPMLAHTLQESLARTLQLEKIYEDAVIQGKCFVAMPFDPSFSPVFAAVQEILESPPYNWSVLRADKEMWEANIMHGIKKHIRESQRCLADISGTNHNVMMELGMMLQKNSHSTLILADEETSTDLPANLLGTIVIPYPSNRRHDKNALKAILKEELPKHPGWSAMMGKRVR